MAPDIPLYTHEVCLDEDELTIHPLSDVHIGARAHHTDKFLQRLNAIKEAGPSHRILLLGDLADIAIKDSVGFSHGAATPQQERDALVQALAPLADRIDLILPGNHERRINKAVAVDYTQVLAVLIGRAEAYRPATTVLRYRFAKRSDGKDGAYRGSAQLFCHHGYGGGRKKGSKLNKAIDLQLIKRDCDLYLMGHVHEQMAALDYCITGWPPRGKVQRTVVTGCFLAGKEHYSMNNAYTPPVVGSPKIRLWVESRNQPTSSYHLQHSVEI